MVSGVNRVKSTHEAILEAAEKLGYSELHQKQKREIQRSLLASHWQRKVAFLLLTAFEYPRHALDSSVGQDMAEDRAF